MYLTYYVHIKLIDLHVSTIVLFILCKVQTTCFDHSSGHPQVLIKFQVLEGCAHVWDPIRVYRPLRLET